MSRREEVGIDLTARDRGATQTVDKVGQAIGRVEQRAGLTTRAVGRMGGAFDKVASGVFMGIGIAAFQQVQRGIGMITSGIFGMNASLEVSTLQFETLMGDAGRAEAHVKSLFEFAARTPFETAPIIEASARLQTFGGDALNTMDNLTLVGDAAAATTAPINELAFWVGRAYSSIQSGRPFGEAAMRLQELAVLSPQARNEMEALQKSGADASAVWAVMEKDLGRFDGAMVKQAGTWGGLTSSIKDNVSILAATSFKPVFDTAKAGMADLLAFLSTPEMQRGAQDFAAMLGETINPDNLRRGFDGVADAVSRIDWASLSRDGQAFVGAFVQFARDVPWATLGQAMTIAGQATRAALDVFNQLPGPVKSVLIGAIAVNKLTGGGITSLAGAGVNVAANKLGVGGAIGGLFGNRGTLGNPMYVIDLADAAPDAVPDSLVGRIGQALAVGAVVAAPVVVLQESGAIDEMVKGLNGFLFGGDRAEEMDEFRRLLAEGVPLNVDTARSALNIEEGLQAQRAAGSNVMGRQPVLGPPAPDLAKAQAASTELAQAMIGPVRQAIANAKTDGSLDLPGGLAAAIRAGRNEVEAAMEQLRSDVTQWKGPEDARVMGYLVSTELANAIDSKDGLIRASAADANEVFMSRLGELVDGNGKLGKAAMDELNAAMRSKDPDIRRQARLVKEAIENGVFPTRAKAAGDQTIVDINNALAAGQSVLGSTSYQLGLRVAQELIRGVNAGVGGAGGPTRQPGSRTQYAVGAYRTKEGPAWIHDDEMILPADFARRVRGDTWGSPAGGGQRGGSVMYVTNHFGRGSVRRDQDISEIGREIGLQAALAGMRTRPGVVGADA